MVGEQFLTTLEHLFVVSLTVLSRDGAKMYLVLWPIFKFHQSFLLHHIMFFLCTFKGILSVILILLFVRRRNGLSPSDINTSLFCTFVMARTLGDVHWSWRTPNSAPTPRTLSPPLFIVHYLGTKSYSSRFPGDISSSLSSFFVRATGIQRIYSRASSGSILIGMKAYIATFIP